MTHPGHGDWIDTAPLSDAEELNRMDSVRVESITLHKAASQNNLSALNRLLTEGADPNALSVAGRTPLMMAAVSGNEIAARDLLKLGADVNATTPDGYTALYFAVCAGYVPVITLLLRHGAKTDYMVTPELDPDGASKIRPGSEEWYAYESTLYEVAQQPGQSTEPATEADSLTGYAADCVGGIMEVSTQGRLASCRRTTQSAAYPDYRMGRTVDEMTPRSALTMASSIFERLEVDDDDN